MNYFIFSLYSALFLYQSAIAAEQENLFTSGRSFGRGGSFVAARDSHEATRLNVATLSESQISYQLRLLDLDFIIGQNSISTISDIISAFSSGKTSKLLDGFSDKFGKQQYFKLQAFPLQQRFGSLEISPYFLNEAWLEVTNPAVPNLYWLNDTNVGGNISYAYRFGKAFSVGLTLRPFYRWYIAGDIDFVDFLEFLPPSTAKIDDYLPVKSGFGLGADLGFLYEVSQNLRTGLTIQNIGDSTYTEKTKKQPPNIKQKVSWGLTHRYIYKYFDIDSYFDIQGIVNRSALNITRLLHYGVELGRSFYSQDHDIGILFGINEGYFTSAFFLDLYIFRLDIANYAVELGEKPGQNIDRRWAFSIKSSMTF